MDNSSVFNIIKNMNPNDILWLGMFIMFFWFFMYNILSNIYDYLYNKAWNVNKYEKMLLKLYNEDLIMYDKDSNEYFISQSVLNNEEKELIYKIKNKYDHINKRRNKSRNLFKKNKK